MSTHRQHEKGEIYFITFTCYKWLPLIERSDSYKSFEGFFKYLKGQLIPLLGYVIMPNHFHGLVYVPENSAKTVNDLTGNGKRFLAYDIVKNLKSKGEYQLLKQLEEGVQAKEREKGKKHQIFRVSFDGKVCRGREEAEKALDYIHRNPVSGKWSLVRDFVRYPWSSAAFYEEGIPNEFLSHYMEFV